MRLIERGTEILALSFMVFAFLSFLFCCYEEVDRRPAVLKRGVKYHLDRLKQIVNNVSLLCILISPACLLVYLLKDTVDQIVLFFIFLLTPLITERIVRRNFQKK